MNLLLFWVAFALCATLIPKDKNDDEMESGR